MKYIAASALSITLLFSGCSGDDSSSNVTLTEASASETSSSNNTAINKKNSVQVAQTKEEKSYIKDYSCFDVSCYTYKNFYNFFTEKYPDIKKVQFHPLDSMRGDKETLDMYKEQFYVGLYYAKQIRLANGQSLFDFLKTCSKTIDPANAAQMNIGKDNDRFLSLQYFPVLRQIDTGREVELNLLFERRGDSITSSSEWLSSHALENKDFLKQHNVECWN